MGLISITMPEISIIVPVYNVEKYLKRCIESILAQTYTDFELILVDDGSPDNSGAICDEYAKNDARIRVIHQENCGQAVARNVALDTANGKYIAFIDSDDYVNPKFLEILHFNAVNYNADISVCRYVHVDTDGISENITSSEAIVYNGAEYLEKGLLGEKPFGVWVLWDKLFRRECFNDIRLPVGRIFEDNAVVYKIIYSSESVVDCEDVLYYYYKNPDSTVNSPFDEKKLDYLIVLEEMIIYFTEKENDVLLNNVDSLYLTTLLNVYTKSKKFLNNKTVIKTLHKKLLLQYKKEKQKYKITPKTNPQILNAVYPRVMWCYWTLQGLKNKFSNR